MRRCLAGGLAVAAGLATAAPADAALRFSRSCVGNFECARLTVPLDRSGAVPGKVRLFVERARATGRRSGAVFAIAGGPGQGASSVTESFNRDLFGEIGTRDLVVVDQRGTGLSGALKCPELERPGDEPIDARTAACARRLGARRGLYTTRESVDDLEAVRAELGIPRITLFGVSYGTYVALAYAQKYPQRVERLVLDSVVDVAGQDPFDLDAFRAIPRVLDELCRGECGGITPSLSRDVAELADRMAAAPLRGPFVDRRGRVSEKQVTVRDLYQRVRAGDGLADLRIDYPGAIRAALDGDPAPLIRIEHAGRDVPLPEPSPEEVDIQAQAVSFTLQAATLCEEAPLPWDRAAPPAERDRQAQERAAALPDAAFEPFDRSAAVAADSNNLLFQCRQWPTAAAPPDPPRPLPDVPTLVLSGREDVRTPLEVAQRVVARFPRGRLVSVPKTGHSVLSGASCARSVVRRFFASRPLGTPCASARRSVRVRPRPPADLDAVPGGSKAQRTLAAVLLTLRDLRQQSLFVPEGGGLRGGSFDDGVAHQFVLRSFSYVPGVAVSGRVDGLGSLAGRLRVTGAAAARGTLRIDRRGRISGSLGGRRVAGRAPAA